MELSCYGFELQHLGLSVVAFWKCTDCLQSLYMHHQGAGLALLGSGYHKMGTDGG